MYEGKNGPAQAQNVPKLLVVAFHVVLHYCWKRSLFMHPVDLIDPFWQPPLWATSCTLPRPIGLRYGGLGVGKGNFEGWKTTKSGWLRPDEVGSKLRFEPRTPRYGLFLVWGCRRPSCTDFGAFRGLLGVVHGHFVD